jgi:catechol 2,3-dioxygenase-like lactoylglutathione lyase family enzyme
VEVEVGIYPMIESDDVAGTRDFYVQLLGLAVVYDSGWFVQLRSSEDPAMELAVVQRGHETVPQSHSGRPSGVLVAVEVDSADAVHERAVALGLPVVWALRTEAWGQRHFMTVDPNGLLVDVIQGEDIPMDEAFVRYVLDP